MVDLQTSTNTPNPDKQGISVALPISKERILELQKNKNKLIDQQTIVRK